MNAILENIVLKYKELSFFEKSQIFINLIFYPTIFYLSFSVSQIGFWWSVFATQGVVSLVSAFFEGIEKGVKEYIEESKVK